MHDEGHRVYSNTVVAGAVAGTGVAVTGDVAVIWAVASGVSGAGAIMGAIGRRDTRKGRGADVGAGAGADNCDSSEALEARVEAGAKAGSETGSGVDSGVAAAVAAADDDDVELCSVGANAGIHNRI